MVDGWRGARNNLNDSKEVIRISRFIFGLGTPENRLSPRIPLGVVVAGFPVMGRLDFGTVIE